MTDRIVSPRTRPLGLVLGSSESDSTSFVHDFEESFERRGCALVSDHKYDPAPVIGVLSQVAAIASGAPDGTGLSLAVSGDGDRWAPEPPFQTFSHAPGRISGEPPGDGEGFTFLQEGADGLRNGVTELIAELNGFGTRMLAAIARFLWLKDDWFDEPVRGSARTICLISSQSEAGKARFLPGRDDADVISVIGVDGQLDLEVRHRWHEDWQRVTLTSSDLLVMTGSMLQRMTNDILKPPICQLANTDECVPPVNIVHFSLPFREDFAIESLPECVDRERYRDRYSGPITARDFRRRMDAERSAPQPRTK